MNRLPLTFLTDNRGRKYLHYQRVMCQTFALYHVLPEPRPRTIVEWPRRIKSFVLNTSFSAGILPKCREAGVVSPKGGLLAGPALVKPTFLAPGGAPMKTGNLRRETSLAGIPSAHFC
jgi:hypothetical protein